MFPTTSLAGPQEIRSQNPSSIFGPSPNGFVFRKLPLRSYLKDKRFRKKKVRIQSNGYTCVDHTQSTNDSSFKIHLRKNKQHLKQVYIIMTSIMNTFKPFTSHNKSGITRKFRLEHQHNQIIMTTGKCICTRYSASIITS